MERIFVKDIKRLVGLKSQIEKGLGVKIKITGTHIEISGKEDGYSEYVAGKALEALDMGFSPESALQLKNEDWIFEKIDIKDHVRPNRVTPVKGRLIGRGGRAKKTLENLTGCEIEVKGHYIGIIGSSNDVDIALDALRKLIQGSPHSKVYAFLERNQEQRRLRKEEEESLNLKE